MMPTLLKILLKFGLYGVAWFFVFCIPVGDNENLFTVIHKGIVESSKKEQKQKTKNKIHREAVIDALSNAFK